MIGCECLNIQEHIRGHKKPIVIIDAHREDLGAVIVDNANDAKLIIKSMIKLINKIEWSDESMEGCVCIPCFKGEDDEL